MYDQMIQDYLSVVPANRRSQDVEIQVPKRANQTSQMENLVSIKQLETDHQAVYLSE
jgi:hypothetical protein